MSTLQGELELIFSPFLVPRIDTLLFYQICGPKGGYPQKGQFRGVGGTPKGGLGGVVPGGLLEAKCSIGATINPPFWGSFWGVLLGVLFRGGRVPQRGSLLGPNLGPNMAWI